MIEDFLRFFFKDDEKEKRVLEYYSAQITHLMPEIKKYTNTINVNFNQYLTLGEKKNLDPRLCFIAGMVEQAIFFNSLRKTAIKTGAKIDTLDLAMIDIIRNGLDCDTMKDAESFGKKYRL